MECWGAAKHAPTFITPFLAMGSFTHIQYRTVLVTELDGLIGVPTRVNLVANINSKTKY